MEHYAIPEKPALFETKYYMGLLVLTVNYNIVEVNNAWNYKSVTLSPGSCDYDAIVNAIVSAEYPADRMQAVVNNYLASPDDAEALEEFATMQQCRAMAKETAKQVLALL